MWVAKRHFLADADDGQVRPEVETGLLARRPTDGIGFAGFRKAALVAH